MVPSPVYNSDGVLRVYYSSCDEDGVGRISFIELSPNDPTLVLYAHNQPVLDIGSPGTFDENGVLPCSVIAESDGTLLMYYAGFEIGKNIRYRLLTGLAKSIDGGKNFIRIQKTPILERSDSELYIRGGPCCIKENSIYKMWYVAGSRWMEINQKEMPIYDIRYLESADGLTWGKSGILHLPVSGHDEFGFGRPYVIKMTDSDYRMFYSIRKKSTNSYRLGYAISTNGHKWQRFDEELNLDVSNKGFDSQEIMYGTPIKIMNKLYLFYNGNNFGEDGIALAVLVDE